MTTHGDLAADLDAALLRGELFAVYQPQIALATGAIVAAEALCRWDHPTHGLVPPDQFIALAEETGAIQAIGRFMLDECLDALSSWHALGAQIEVSVNVSPLQLTGLDFVDYLSEQVRQHLTPRHTLTIEITESRPVLDLADVARRLNSVRAIGVGIALDDYGTGHTSPQQLEQLPVTELKLDRSLIQDDDALRDAELVRTVDRARTRGVRIVAEGIETTSQLRLATDIGCERAQGYLLGEPVDRPAFDALIAA